MKLVVGILNYKEYYFIYFDKNKSEWYILNTYNKLTRKMYD